MRITEKVVSDSRVRPLLYMLISLVWALSACHRADDAPAQAAPIAIPPPPAVGDAPGPYSLRYFSATTGELLAVHTPAEVPQGARGQVIVSPDDPALSGPWLYVADLSKLSGASYPVTTVQRAELEAQIAKAHPPAPSPPPGPATAASTGAMPVGSAGSAGTGAAPAQAAAVDRDVVIFRTAWCGYCKKTAEYLKLKGVPFVEKDIERDAGARDDMLARAQRAGVPASQLQGVPILSVHGKIITGFNRQAIDRALGT